MLVRDVLSDKGSDVATIAPTATVAQLVEQLATQRVGALIVSTETIVVAGIVSERDVARALHSNGARLLEMPVSELMTKTVRTCAPDDEISQVATIMTEQRIRHLPVVEEGNLVGIVSIGDIVKKRIDQLEDETDHLINYVST